MQTHAKFFSYILYPSCYMFRPWVSLTANPCPTLVAFEDLEIQLALDRLFRNPAHKPTALRTSVSLGGLAWFLDMFYWESWPYDGLYLVSIACIWQDKYCRKLDFTVEGSQAHTDTHRRTQTHVHARRRTQMNTDKCRRAQTNADERKANCVWCVGGRNLKTRPDIRRLFKDFRDVL